MKIEFTPVGVSFKDTAPNLRLLKSGSIVSFEHRPAFYGTGDNRKEYPNAVVILFKGKKVNKKVGSLAESSSPDSPQQLILKMIKSGLSPEGKVLEMIVPKSGEKFKKTYKLSVEVSDVENVPKKGIEQKKSFNEPEVVINYDDINHTYFKGKKELIAVTNYIKKFYKGFDTDNVSKVCAKSWGIGEQDIRDLWSSSGDIASGFGTAIHNALEFYENNKKLGKIISKARDVGTNYVLPKHPILRSIIEGFIAINPYEKDGYDIVTEALITSVSDALCGHADRIMVLDWDKKICRVGDYKINIEAEIKSYKNKVLPPFDYLPSNKVSKYQLQMSIYANMLQKCGWTVEGLDVYILDKEWKHIKLEVLNILDN